MTDPPDPLVTVRPPLRSSRTLAVILSFLVPGTGQLMNGRTRAGLVLKTRDLPDLALLAEQVDIKGMTMVRFVPPSYPSHLDRAAIKRIRSAVADVFDDAVPPARRLLTEDVRSSPRDRSAPSGRRPNPSRPSCRIPPPAHP